MQFGLLQQKRREK